MNAKQPSKPRSRSGWIMLGITAVLYAITLYSAPSMARAALEKSLIILKTIAPIIVLVFFLMALLGTFIKPKRAAKYLGKNSGPVAWVVALIGGVLSHGPSYVWYPMLSELRNNGVRDGLIVTFFYARAVKLPWLPVMISYFGSGFTLLLSIYILLGAWLQGILADRLMQGSEFANAEPEKNKTD